jgi:hypothetical protein
MIYLIYCKNLCKCYSVPPSTTIRKNKENKTQPNFMKRGNKNMTVDPKKKTKCYARQV